MSAIVERKGRFMARVRNSGQEASRTFTRKTDAMAWAKRTEVEMEKGEWQRQKAAALKATIPTLRDAIGEYRVKVVAKMKSAKESEYRLQQLSAAPFAGAPIDQVKPVDISGWRDTLLLTRQQGTVRRLLGMLSGMFTWAVKECEWLDSNPMARVRLPRDSESRTRTLSADEWHWLMHAANSSKAAWLSSALIVLARSAMRRGEIFGLKRADVDYTASTAFLADTKSGVARHVPLDPVALAGLQALDAAAALRGDDRLLPVGAVGSISVRFIETVRRARLSYLEDCEVSGRPAIVGLLEDCRLHDLRHHAVSMWANTGELTLQQLMGISGHRTTAMVLRYSHMNVSTLAAKMATLNT